MAGRTLGSADLTGARDWFARTADLVRERSIPGTLPALDHASGVLLRHEGQTGKARAAPARADLGWTARGRGATNREFAAALYISPKTAAAHDEHIRSELGFARRAQIAAWVAVPGELAG